MKFFFKELNKEIIFLLDRYQHSNFTKEIQIGRSTPKKNNQTN